MPALINILISKEDDVTKIRRLTEQLLQFKASLDEKDETDNNNPHPSVLHAACLNSGPPVLAWLLEKKPDLLNAKSDMGTNALSYAAKYGNKPALDYLLTLDKKDDYKRTKAVNYWPYYSTILYFAVISGNVDLF